MRFSGAGRGLEIFQREPSPSEKALAIVRHCVHRGSSHDTVRDKRVDL